MEELTSLAEVAVVVGANVQPGQVVRVTASVEQIAIVQAIADAAYRHAARVNNTIVPGPHPGWARMRYPEMAADEALAALWRDIAIATRLDTADPVAHWRSRFTQLTARAAHLSELRLDAIHLHGPDTDLTLGLLANVRWDGPTNVSQRGVLHAWNIPSEEIFTSPDPARVNGFARLTRPAIVGGALIRNVTLTFREGEVIHITGGPGVEHLHAFVNRDDGTRRVGEIALVDAESAVARIEQPFGTCCSMKTSLPTLLWASDFQSWQTAETRNRINTSADHLDLTIGSPEIEITGVRGTEHQDLPLIRNGQWVLEASQR